jgi:hypothetical protein
MVEIRAELVAQRCLLRGVIDIHGLTLPSTKPE